MMGTSQMPWNLVGYKCYICYSTSTYVNVSNDEPTDKEYRQRVMESCADNLFSEIIGDEFDWNLFVCDRILPFCSRCWQSMEKLYNLNQNKEKTDGEIENIVKDIGMKVLSNRKYLKKKGILSTSKTNPIVQMEGLKIEGFTASQTKCRMCHNVFEIGESQNLLPVDMTRKIMECCEKHLYTELIDEDFFDWNSISFTQFVPFCEDCSLDIKTMLNLDEKLVGFEKSITQNVGMFTLSVLECRKLLKKAKRRAFLQENGFRDDSSVADSIESQGTLDFDDDCQIIDDTTIFPTSFAESTFSEPLSEFMEQPSSFETFNSARNGYNTDPIRIEATVPVIVAEGASNSRFSFADENGLERPNSAETCVILPQAQNSTVQGMTDRRDLPRNVSLHQFAPQICCERTFTDEESWDVHRVSHRSLSFSTTQSKSKSLPLQSQPQSMPSRAPPGIPPRRDKRSQSQTPEEYPSSQPTTNQYPQYRCSHCPRRCRTKTGINLHIQSHTKKATYKCRLCKLLFRYPIELKKHFTHTHAENSYLNKSKPNKTHANTHRSKISKKRRTGFACPFCTFPIVGKNDLIAHVQIHYDIAEGSRCEICKLVFSSKKSIGPHNKSFHSQLKIRH